RRKIEAWRGELTRAERAGQRIVIWGAGSKGVGFLNMLGVESAIDAVVDVNPRKHGMHVAGTGQRIIAPESLRDVRPDVVVVMNPIYETEIRDQIVRLGLAPVLVRA
ncbi:MAG: methyltransferase, partial [Armatimonadota bacterium]